MAGIVVQGGGHSLGALPGREINASMRRGGFLGPTDTWGDSESRDWREVVMGPRGASTGIL